VTAVASPRVRMHVHVLGLARAHAHAGMMHACYVHTSYSERAFVALIEDDQIAQIEPASGHEAYHETERAAWAHPAHPTRECPFDMWAWKRATYGPNWC
jgi:hypothetical protein